MPCTFCKFKFKRRPKINKNEKNNKTDSEFLLFKIKDKIS